MVERVKELAPKLQRRRLAESADLGRLCQRSIEIRLMRSPEGRAAEVSIACGHAHSCVWPANFRVADDGRTADWVEIAVQSGFYSTTRWDLSQRLSIAE